MKRLHLIYAGLGVGLVIAAAMAIDGDPAGMVAGRVEAPSAMLSQFPQADLADAQRGAVYFAFGDFSALSTETLDVSAAPWKLSTALLALHHGNGDLAAVTPEKVADIFRDYGFVTPSRIANWPADLPDPEFNAPLGQNLGFASRVLPPIGVTIANISCAGCHASVVYGADGQPDVSTVWLGTPNGSINLERYVSELYTAMRDRPADTDLIWRAIEKLYPQTEWREWLALRAVVLPRVDSLVAEREATIGQLLPFEVSTMGATNGLQALQARFGILPNDHLADRNAPISVPELGGRIWRSSLLASGAYTIPGKEPQQRVLASNLTYAHAGDLAALTAFFTVPSMGTSPATAAGHVDDATRIFSWLRNYRPQPFPAPVDLAAAERGRGVYARDCASCHGIYSDDLDAPELLEFPNWQGDMGTDRTYIELFDADTVAMINGLGYETHLEARLAADYVAQPLTGLWSSAPYLHNGSIPTLWHLMHPDQRPAAFDVGGHAMDFERVGIAGIDQGDVWATPPNYTPWARPERVDTSIPGLGAGGHEKPFDTMNEADKADLLDYLKLL